MPFMSGAGVCGSRGAASEGFGGLGVGGCSGKMIACDVSQVVILGQGTAGSFPASKRRL